MRPFILPAIFMAGSAAIPSSLQIRDTSTCPYYLPDGGYEFPHLIVPINKSNIAIGHSYFATVTPNNFATIFNFDIPSSRAYQQCSVYLTFPKHNQLATSDFEWKGYDSSVDGPGSLQLVQYQYNTGATNTTTGDTQPSFGPEAIINLDGVVPGNSYKAWSGSCDRGGIMSWRLSSLDSSFTYFQDWNLCAIGLWVVYEGAVSGTGPSCGQCPDRSMFKSRDAWLEAYMS